MFLLMIIYNNFLNLGVKYLKILLLNVLIFIINNLILLLISYKYKSSYVSTY